MVDPHRIYEVRCPVYGFVALNDWEREIISQAAFQRLRRIRQLGWTDYVYPGAVHTRFEHSLGVVHMATLLYEGVVARSKDLLRNELGYYDAGLERDKALVRLAALLHDVGHSPFSHAAEELYPAIAGGTAKYQHEHYTAEIVRRNFADVIKNHPLNTNYGFNAEDIAALLEGSSDVKNALFWRDLIVGQMDADRMDYLLRDSLHAGVDYGRYDWRRLANTIEAVSSEDGSPRLGVSEGGWHAAEGMILARYFMFTQVYFHKTRVAFDHHLQYALMEMLPEDTFPTPKGDDLAEYLKWDDWRVLGMLSENQGGEHGRRLYTRDHFREIVHTSETPTESQLEELERWREALGDLLAHEAQAEKSWYKVGQPEIPVASKSPTRNVLPLSEYSSVVARIEPIRKVALYARPENIPEARKKLESL